MLKVMWTEYVVGFWHQDPAQSNLLRSAIRLLSYGVSAAWTVQIFTAEQPRSVPEILTHVGVAVLAIVSARAATNTGGAGRIAASDLGLFLCWSGTAWILLLLLPGSTAPLAPEGTRVVLLAFQALWAALAVAHSVMRVCSSRPLAVKSAQPPGKHRLA